MSEYRQVFNYFDQNTSGKNKVASYTINKPSSLQKNLDKKTMRVQKLTIGNTAVPIFIPNPVLDPTFLNVNTNAGSTMYVNDTYSVNSLGYYIVFRKADNSQAWVSFLQQVQLYPTVLPPVSPITDAYTYYSNPYYYYYDFTHFLSILIAAITAAWTATGDPDAPSPIIWINKGGYFQFFVQNTTTWYIDFSPELVQLLPFKNIPTVDGFNRIIFDTTPVTINGLTYYEVDANFYSTIFPFAQIILQSPNANLAPISFLDTAALSSNVTSAKLEHSILTYDIVTDNFLGVYDFFQYVSNYDGLWVNFYSAEDTTSHFTINIFLRLKNNLIIPYITAPNENTMITIELKYQK